MDSTQTVGLLLIALSAVLLASHWQLGASSPPGDALGQAFLSRQRWRRTVASSLIGLVGVALIAFDRVPRTPLSITAYLFALVLMTCWILWLGLMDLRATRKYRDSEQLDRIAAEVRRAKLPSSAKEVQELCDSDQ